MDSRVIGVGVLVTLLVCFMSLARTPARAIVAGQGLDQRVAELEAAVGSDPHDAVALHALVEAYLAHHAPGLAQAALDRAPAALRRAPSIADQRARTLSLLGHPQLAFAAQSAVLAECSRQGCDPTLEGRARYRLEWLRQLLELDVGDPRLEPERAQLAYRLASRSVQLEVH